MPARIAHDLVAAGNSLEDVPTNPGNIGNPIPGTVWR
jgi:hypothetical protein